MRYMLDLYSSTSDCGCSIEIVGRLVIFFFTVAATTEIYTLSLHDALPIYAGAQAVAGRPEQRQRQRAARNRQHAVAGAIDRKSTRLNSSHVEISYAVFCLKKKMTLSPCNSPARTRSSKSFNPCLSSGWTGK